MKEITALFIIDVGWKLKASKDFRRAEEQTVNGRDVIIMFQESEDEEIYVYLDHVAMIRFKEVK